VARPQRLISAFAVIVLSVGIMMPAEGAGEPAGIPPGTTPDTGSLSVSPTTFADGEKVKVSANFPDGTFDVSLYKETAPDVWSTVGVTRSSSSGNASFSGFQVTGVQKIYARITSGKKAGRTEVVTLTPKQPEVVMPTESDIGSLTVSPTAFSVGDDVKITANFPDGTFDVTLYRETAPDVWTSVGKLKSSSSGNVTFSSYRIDSAHPVFARITSGSKHGRTEVLTLTPQPIAPTGKLTGKLTSTPASFAAGADLKVTANFPDGTFDVLLYREAAPGEWAPVATAKTGSNGNATFTYPAGDWQKLFARKRGGDRTEVDALQASTACGGAATVQGPGVTWRCTFSDEFDGSTLDPSKWGITQTGATGFRSGGECYMDSPDNVSVANGQLDLTTRALPNKFACLSPVDGWITRYTSGMVTTAQRLEQQYGRFEVRARFVGATTAGLQSAIWLWPATKAYGAWPRSGEIDIAEYYTSNADRVYPFVHYTSSTYDPTVTNTKCMLDHPEEFHVYSVEWTPQVMNLAVDGHVCVSTGWDLSAPLVNPAPFDRPFYLNLTQALGIGQNAFIPGTTPLPASMQIDHVRIWG
jgi:beta-glucanase (GH16 family)